jgi:hypothetical protein
VCDRLGRESHIGSGWDVINVTRQRACSLRNAALADAIDVYRVTDVTLFVWPEILLILIRGHSLKTDGTDGIMASILIVPMGESDAVLRVHHAS